MEKIIDGLKHGIGFVLVVGVFVFGLYLAKAWLPDSNGLIAQNGDVLTAEKWNSIIPRGSIVAFNSENCPVGRDLADGVDDPLHSGGVNSMDLRGRFLRGTNIGTSRDPNFSTRSGGLGVYKIGSYQDDSLKAHDHKLRMKSTVGEYTGWGIVPDNLKYHLNPGYTELEGDLETRPKNVAVLYCIKE